MKKYTLTAEELAESFNVSKRTVYTWIDTKGLPAVKIGGTIRFNIEDIEEWVRSQQGKREGE